MVPIWIVISVLVFLLKAYAPIDEADVRTQMLLQDPNHPSYERLYENQVKDLGLDSPVFYVSLKPKDEGSSIFPPQLRWHGVDNQYHRWWTSFLSGDHGTSLLDDKPIRAKISSAMSWTIMISLISFLITLLVGIPMGIFQARNQEHWLDRCINMIGTAIYAMPLFWIGTLAILFLTSAQYGAAWHWFSTPGLWRSSGEGFFSRLYANTDLLVLPILLMSFKDIFFVSRLTRRSVLEEAKKPYVLALRSKGLSEQMIYRKHVTANALSTLITLVVSSIPNILGGALIIEVLFNIPGMGRLTYESIVRADWPVVFPIILLSAGITMVSYLIGDIALAYLFPKLRKV